MWRRVAQQSPDQPGSGEMAYKMAYSAISDLLFAGHSLSGHERNSLFLNPGPDAKGRPRRFANASLSAGFGFDDDTRAVGVVDWDEDGDLDVWISNRTAPRLRFLKNESPVTDRWIAFTLAGTSCNRDAIGARVELTCASGRVFHAGLRAGAGFLTQSSKVVHFGLGEEKPGLLSVRVRWPGGEAETFANLERGHRYRLTQGTARAAEETPRSKSQNLVPSVPAAHPWGPNARAVLVGRLPVPDVPIQPIMAPPASLVGGPRLLTFFATWCNPCVEELTELASQEDSLRAAGLDVTALNVDELEANPNSTLSKSRALLGRIKWPFGAVGLTPEAAGALDVFHRSFLSLRRPLPLPSSFLLDAEGRLAVIYRGPIDAGQVVSDAALLPLSPANVRDRGLPFHGGWQSAPPAPSLVNTVVAWKREGCLEVGEAYLKNVIEGHLLNPLRPDRPAPEGLALLCEHLADFHRQLKRPDAVQRDYRLALEFDGNNVSAHSTLGTLLGKANRLAEAIPHLEKAAELAPQDPHRLTDLGVARIMQGRIEDGVALLEQAVLINPTYLPAHLNLGRVAAQRKDWAAALRELRVIWKTTPGSPAALPLLRQIISNQGPEHRQALAKEFGTLPNPAPSSR
ncbi:MAG: ASPIC/UnbV domain-containing protein [Verrucomicrobiales bacterium]